jgi:hypothetical protein
MEKLYAKPQIILEIDYCLYTLNFPYEDLSFSPLSLVVLGVEFRASCLLSKGSATFSFSASPLIGTGCFGDQVSP